MMRKMVVWVLFIFLLGACAPRGNAEVIDAGMQPENPTPVPESKGVDDEAVIVYERSGGITGKTVRYRVYADGRISSGENEETRVSPEEVEAALDTIEQAGFFEMKGTLPQKSACYDCYTYSIQVRKGGKSGSLAATDNGNLPEEVRAVIEEVEGLVGGG